MIFLFEGEGSKHSEKSQVLKEPFEDLFQEACRKPLINCIFQVQSNHDVVLALYHKLKGN